MTCSHLRVRCTVCSELTLQACQLGGLDHSSKTDVYIFSNIKKFNNFLQRHYICSQTKFQVHTKAGRLYNSFKWLHNCWEEIFRLPVELVNLSWIQAIWKCRFIPGTENYEFRIVAMKKRVFQSRRGALTDRFVAFHWVKQTYF